MRWLGSAKGDRLMARSHGCPLAARAAQIRGVPIKSQLLPTESLVIAAINGVLVLIIFAGLVVSGMAYAIAISSLARDFFAGQSESAGSSAIHDAHAGDRDAEPR